MTMTTPFRVFSVTHTICEQKERAQPNYICIYIYATRFQSVTSRPASLRNSNGNFQNARDTNVLIRWDEQSTLFILQTLIVHLSKFIRRRICERSTLG